MKVMKKHKFSNNIRKFKCLRKTKKFQIFNTKIKKNFNNNILGEYRDLKDFKKRF